MSGTGATPPPNLGYHPAAHGELTVQPAPAGTGPRGRRRLRASARQRRSTSDNAIVLIEAAKFLGAAALARILTAAGAPEWFPGITQLSVAMDWESGPGIVTGILLAIMGLCYGYWALPKAKVVRHLYFVAIAWTVFGSVVRAGMAYRSADGDKFEAVVRDLVKVTPGQFVRIWVRRVKLKVAVVLLMDLGFLAVAFTIAQLLPPHWGAFATDAWVLVPFTMTLTFLSMVMVMLGEDPLEQRRFPETASSVWLDVLNGLFVR